MNEIEIDPWSVDENVVTKVIKTVKRGLVCGLGEPTPGKMCVEAAICYAYGLPHGDHPPCVEGTIADLKIELNDQEWSSDRARAKGLLKIAIAQLGSKDMDIRVFHKEIRKYYFGKILPEYMREMKFPSKYITLAKKIKGNKDIGRLSILMDKNHFPITITIVDDIYFLSGKELDWISSISTMQMQTKSGDKYLLMAADAILKALKTSPGYKYLYLAK